MAWNQTDIDALKGAIKTGIRRVTFTDRTVEYQDMTAMIRALRIMEAEVATSTTKTTPARTVLVQHGRGI